MMQEYTVIARFRQPPWPDGHHSIIELRQYGADIARHVNGRPQEWTSGFYIYPSEVAARKVQSWIDFERKIGSEMEQWVKLT